MKWTFLSALLLFSITIESKAQVLHLYGGAGHGVY